MQIRNVPEDDHAEIVLLARTRGISVQEVLMELVHAAAARQRNRRLLADHAAFLAGGRGLSAAEADDAVARERQARLDALTEDLGGQSS